jgi:hypothetical protein
MSPITGVTKIDVIGDKSRSVGTIRTGTQISRIVEFLNARRDHWYDPQGMRFATSGALRLYDARGARIAIFDFGTGGMAQRRAGMTYRDSVTSRDFIVIRGGDHEQTVKDFGILCDLLGAGYHAVCTY